MKKIASSLTILGLGLSSLVVTNTLAVPSSRLVVGSIQGSTLTLRNNVDLKNLTNYALEFNGTNANVVSTKCLPSGESAALQVTLTGRDKLQPPLIKKILRGGKSLTCILN